MIRANTPHHGPLMFRRKFTAPPAPEIPIYVVGDIHGRRDLLEQIIHLIDADAGASGTLPATIITVGDYIDRGPDPAGVIDYLMALAADPARQMVNLIGNHEDMLLTYLADVSKARIWLRNGGTETLLALGLPPLTENADPQEAAAVAPQLAAALGPRRLEFLQNLDLTFRTGNIFVCHAGTDPALPLDAQDRRVLIWNRDYKKIRRDGNWVIHGHTITSKARVADGRVNIDTGAYFSDRLTAARIAEGTITLIDTQRGRHDDPA